MLSSSSRPWRDECDFLALAARSRLAADDAGGEADRELLADLAVVVRHDVTGVGVQTDQSCHLDVEAGFLLGLAHRGIGDRFADFDAAAGECPQVVVGLVDQQDFPSVVDGDCDH